MAKKKEIKVETKGMNWRVWFNKAIKMFGITILSGLVVVWQNDPKYMFLIPIIDRIINFLKHTEYINFWIFKK